MTSSRRMRSSPKTSTCRFLSLLVAAALGGCSATVISDTWYDGSFDPREAVSAAVVVRGAPFGSTAGLEDAVIDAMRGNTGYRTALSPAPPGALPTYRTVLTFDPPPQASGAALCGALASLPEPAPGNGGRIALSAAFCRGDRAMSEAFGFFTARDIADPAFASAIAAFTHALFPSVNRLTDSFDMS
jgi:hypothetical protein